ncbi:MAG TPA: tetratricopeptide repeat protein [Thermoanaerobaculia bacterium]
MSATISLVATNGDCSPEPEVLHAQIAVDPQNTELHRALSVALLLRNDVPAALVSAERALAIGPREAESHCLLGQIHLVRNDLQAADVSFRQAAELDPESIEARAQIAIVLLAQGKSSEASAMMTELVARHSDSPLLWANLGACRRACGDHEGAVVAYRRAIGLQPEWTAIRRDLARALNQQGRFTEAENELRTAAEREPDCAEGFFELGISLQITGQLKEALTAYEQCLALQPESSLALLNAAAIASALGQTGRAIDFYRQAFIRNPGFRMAHLDFGMAALMAGNFKDGLREFEWRWPAGGATLHRPELQVPLWDGTPLNGRSLLLWCEQGFGDVLQFVRFVDRIEKNGGRIVLHAPKKLARLLATCRGVDEVVGDDDWLDADVQFPLVSLPSIIGVGIDSLGMTPYLAPPEQCEAAEQAVVPDAAHLNVGVVWKSGALYRRHRLRDCDVATVADLSTIPGVRLFSLQFGEAAPDVESWSDAMIDLSDRLGDFFTTAAFVKRLDLVITVDTAMAHLAGALGVPVWLLLNAHSEWRWMLDRADSPWYPTMRIYRQTRSGDWTAVFDQVRRELESLARMKTGATEARSKLPPRTIPPKTFVKQYGERRTGTNFVRALLCANYHVEVLMHIFGDKHSAPAPFDEYWREAQSDPMPARAFAWRATFSVPAATTNALDPLQVEDVTEMADGIANAFASRQMRFVVSIRDPYAWAVSLGWFLGWSARGTPIPDEQLDELRSACLRFNERYAAWFTLAKTWPEHCFFVRYEDVYAHPEVVCERMSTAFALARRSRRWRNEEGIVLPANWDHARPSLERRFESINDRERASQSYLTLAARSVITTAIDWVQIAQFYTPDEQLLLQ